MRLQESKVERGFSSCPVLPCPINRQWLFFGAIIVIVVNNYWFWFVQAINQPAVICYTSGTTANPKGVLLSQVIGITIAVIIIKGGCSLSADHHHWTDRTDNDDWPGQFNLDGSLSNSDLRAFGRRGSHDQLSPCFSHCCPGYHQHNWQPVFLLFSWIRFVIFGWSQASEERSTLPTKTPWRAPFWKPSPKSIQPGTWQWSSWLWSADDDFWQV